VRLRLSSKVILALLLAVLASLPVLADTTVYVTRTGTKYHTANCRYLRSSSRPVALSEAAALYTPCSVCQPPRPGAAKSEAENRADTAPRVEPSPEQREERCAATTKKGTQCLRKPKAGSAYCWQHAR
jgi:hypothetical protein